MSFSLPNCSHYLLALFCHWPHLMRGCLCGHWSCLSSSWGLLFALPLCQIEQAQLSQMLLRGHVMAILTAFCWTLLSPSLSFMTCRAPDWAQLFRHGLFSAGAPLTCCTFLSVAQYWLSSFPGILPLAHIHIGPCCGPWYLQQGCQAARQPLFSCACVWGYSSPCAEHCSSAY